MAAAEDDASAPATLERTCHICEEPVESHVWYAKTTQDEDDERPHRVYACPSCFFELADDDRGGYYRERV